MEIELWWHFGNFTQLMPAFTPPTALFIPDQTPFPSINFFLFSFHVGLSIPTGSCFLSSQFGTPSYNVTQPTFKDDNLSKITQIINANPLVW